MGSIHVVLPEFTRFPVFVEQEVGGVLVVLMKIVLNAAFFRPRDRDQFLQLGFDQIDLVGIRKDVRNDGEFRHFRSPWF